MFNLNLTFVFVLINLLILYLIVRKFLFKRVGDILDQRARAIQSEMDAGRLNRQEAENLRQKYEAELDSVKDECGRVLEDARKRAQSEYERIVADAKRDASAMLETARQKTETERAAAFKGHSEEVCGLIIEAASKVIGANMDSERNRAFVAGILREKGAA